VISRRIGRAARALLAAAMLATIAALLPAPATGSPAPPGTDWSRAVVDATLARFPQSAQLGGWGYQRGLYLYGQYLVYRRTGDPRYLRYLQGWVDRFVDSAGHVDNAFDSLDNMQAGNLLVLLYQETKQARYRTAATQIRARLDSYPRTSDGGFWHATSRQHQLWLDGTYMLLPFLVRYGDAIGDRRYAEDEASRQLLVYASHLAGPSGLLYHAYDESGTQSWVDPKTHHSPEFWCRAVGWYGMASVDVLDHLPADHPNRSRIVQLVRNLVQAIARYQDPATGRWFQVVNRGDLAQNWTETSCSSMFTYVVDKAVQRHYVDAGYQGVAQRGYRGVLREVGVGADGLTDVADICVGTNVGDLPFYLARPRATNDFHGLGAFLIMNEQLAGHPLPG
jgi:unsaturated rhamnogalacturonyl hydrolase